MEKLKNIKAIAFDADDTLWALQNYFEDVEHEYCELLAEYGKERIFMLLSSRRRVKIWLIWVMVARLSPYPW